MAQITLQFIKKPAFPGPSPIHIRPSLVSNDQQQQNLSIFLQGQSQTCIGLGHLDIRVNTPHRLRVAEVPIHEPPRLLP